MSSWRPSRALVLGLVGLFVLGGGAVAAWATLGAVRARFDRTSVTHGLVLERVEAVAKLVSSESTIRDVVIYENTWYGSTKRSLVVVTGKVLAGIDLNAGAAVDLDSLRRRIDITLPRARILAIEITNLRTYDEQRGWWNPFRPADRDALYHRVRAQLARAGAELELTQHAERSAAQLLSTMFGTDGWTAVVSFRP